MQGRQVLQLETEKSSGTFNTSLNTGSLPTGHYILQIQWQNSKVIKKFQVVKE
jgi:hypothetical protein